MLDRLKIQAAFRQAIEELSKTDGARRVSPRALAVRAHEIFGMNLSQGEKRPALVTFRKYVAGRSALPEVVTLLEAAQVNPAPHAKLDREKFQAVFQDAIARLESRILSGRAKPADVIRRAYDLYTRDIPDGALKPSLLTFQKLMYGKAADPRILSLLKK